MTLKKTFLSGLKIALLAMAFAAACAILLSKPTFNLLGRPFHVSAESVRWRGMGRLELRAVNIALDKEHLVSVGSVELRDYLRPDKQAELQIGNLQTGDFARVESVKALWTWAGLHRREVDYLDVTGARISLDRLTAAYPPSEKKTGPGENLSRPFLLKELRIRQSYLLKNIFGARLPSFNIPIAYTSPDLVFKDLRLGGPTDDPAANKPVETVLENYTIYSPYDGISPMLSFGKIRAVFSWAGIQQKKIESLQITEPTIYVGNDLFWFAEDIKKGAQKENGAAKDESYDPWTIGLFSVSDGRLELTAYGRSSVPLPFHFFIEPHMNLVVGNLTQLHLKTVCEIPTTTIEYPDYGPLKFVNFGGKMEFSLPVSDERANNIVNALHAERIEWKGLAATQSKIWATYDAKGIYGGFFAKTYGGTIGGDLTFLWDNDLSWIGSFYTQDANVEPATRLLSPENFTMTGPVTSRFVARGQARAVKGVGGEVKLTQKGKMQIVAVDDLLAKLPPDWAPMKRDIAAIALKAFRDYDYDQGTCEFAYAPPQSFARLRLSGLQGERNFDIRWHDKIKELESIPTMP
ncbi:MAG: hypothetical protein V1746_03095 [bacterium]